jgi:hypothetical protein
MDLTNDDDSFKDIGENITTQSGELTRFIVNHASE